MSAGSPLAERTVGGFLWADCLRVDGDQHVRAGDDMVIAVWSIELVEQPVDDGVRHREPALKGKPVEHNGGALFQMGG